MYNQLSEELKFLSQGVTAQVRTLLLILGPYPDSKPIRRARSHLLRDANGPAAPRPPHPDGHDRYLPHPHLKERLLSRHKYHPKKHKSCAKIPPTFPPP